MTREGQSRQQRLEPQGGLWDGAGTASPAVKQKHFHWRHRGSQVPTGGRCFPARPVSSLRGPSIPAPGGTQSRDHGAEAGRLPGGRSAPTSAALAGPQSKGGGLRQESGQFTGNEMKPRPSLLSSTVSIWEEETIWRWSVVLVDGL